jgi:hypothetical protein
MNTKTVGFNWKILKATIHLGSHGGDYSDCGPVDFDVV